MSQEDSILIGNKALKPTRAANKTKDSTFERIYKYYHDKSRLELDDEENGIRERWEKAWLILTRHRTQKTTVEILERLFDVKKSTAYDDVRHAMMLFGDLGGALKDAKRAIFETSIIEGAKKAWRRGDLEMHLKYMKEYKEVNGLNLEDDSKMKDLLKNLKAQQIVFVTSTDVLKKQAESLLQNIPTVDIEHQQVDEGEEDED